MTEAEAVKIVREHFEGLFPKDCPSCGHRFGTLQEYILLTKRHGVAMSYDAELGNWETVQPMGSVAMANCLCGSTLSLGTEGMPLPQRLELLKWVKTETERRGMSPSELLEHMRDEIRRQVLSGATPGDK